MNSRFKLSLVLICTTIWCATLIQAQNNSTTTNNNNNTTTANNNTSSTGNSTSSSSNLTCSVNQTVADSGQDCLTCENPTGTCGVINDTRCYCNQGYIRSDTNDCILPRDCSTNGECFSNASRLSMSSNCFTCDNYRTASCPLSRITQCYCNDGFVLDIDNRRCVYPADCPVYAYGQCRANQTFSDRGYDCDTCANYLTNRECFVSSQTKCYCNVGFVREVRTQRCVLYENCPSNLGDDCSVNQTLSRSGYDCATCANPEASCSLTNQTKCYCLNSYIRNADGDCILPSDCNSTPNLPAGASCRDPWSIGCNPHCVPTCRRRQFGFTNVVFCSPSCRSCFCPSGQVRNDNGDCIPQNQCPQYPYRFPHFQYIF